MDNKAPTMVKNDWEQRVDRTTEQCDQVTKIDVLHANNANGKVVYL